jgi:hypothetical protein
MHRTLVLAAFAGLFACNYIVLRYNISVSRSIRHSEYAALAELRYRIRQFLRGSDIAAAAARLEPHCHHPPACRAPVDPPSQRCGFD